MVDLGVGGLCGEHGGDEHFEGVGVVEGGCGVGVLFFEEADGFGYSLFGFEGDFWLVHGGSSEKVKGLVLLWLCGVKSVLNGKNWFF